MNVSLTLAWRYLRGRMGRTVLTTLAIVFGVAVIFGLNGMLPGMISAFNSTLLTAAGQVDLSVTSASGGTFDPSVADDISRVPGIAATSPSIRRSVGMPRDTAVGVIALIGIEPRSAVRVRGFSLTSGRLLNTGDSGQVVIGSDTAEKLGTGLGGRIAIPTVGGLQQFTVVGLLKAGSSPGTPEVYVTLADAEKALGLSGRINTVEARFTPGAERTTVEAAVRRRVGSDYTVGGISSLDSLLAAMKVSQFAFSMFGVFALIMGGFIILNTFRTLVSERRHDIGMLRAIGADQRTILGIFLAQSVIQGVLGTAVGLVTGWLLAVGLIGMLSPVYKSVLKLSINITPIFTVGTWVTAIALGMGVTILGAIVPARQAARITPLEALRPQLAEVVERQRSRVVLAGWALLVTSVALLLTRQSGMVGLGAALTLVGLVMVAPALIEPLASAMSRVVRPFAPATADLSSSNLTRQPGRAAATASAILVSLAVVVAMVGLIASIYAGFFDYIDKSLGSDFVLIPEGLLLGGSHIGADDALVRRIADTPGISNVATLRLGAASINGGQVQVVGIDPVGYPKVASFTFSGETGTGDVAKLALGRTMLVNGIYAAQNGVRPGQRLPVETPNGLKYYTVQGIATDYLNAKLATVYISQERLAEDFAVTSNVMVLANKSSAAPLSTVKAALSRTLAAYPQFVLYDAKSFKESQSTIFAQSLGLFYALIGMLALPTLLALINTLAISVLARTREIGMLRAVGTTREQVRGMVVAESLLLASVGVLFGIAGGIALGYALVYAMNATGFVMPYFFPWAGIVTAIISGFAFALLAAWYPARRAAKLDIVTALHYE